MWKRLILAIYPLVTLLLILAAWQGYVTWFNVPSYLLPTPGAVVASFVEAYGSGYIWPHLWFTSKATVLGYALGCFVGLVLGVMLAEVQALEKFVYPYVIMLQSMPKVALAPLITVWFGFGLESKVVMVALICFFPVFINAFVGVQQADRDLIDVLRVSSASRLQIFVHVKAAAAAGSIFAGLQIAVVLGLIGAIVAEFVASREGIGILIQRAATDLNTSLMLTGAFTLAAMGLIGNTIIRFLHKRIVFWEGQKHQAANTTAAVA